MEDSPLITPRQMNFLRALTAMAWADGVLESAEVSMMTEHLVHLFTHSEDIPPMLQTQIQGEPVYMRVRQVSRHSVTVVLNDAEMTLKF